MFSLLRVRERMVKGLSAHFEGERLVGGIKFGCDGVWGHKGKWWCGRVFLLSEWGVQVKGMGRGGVAEVVGGGNRGLGAHLLLPTGAAPCQGCSPFFDLNNWLQSMEQWCVPICEVTMTICLN